MDDSVDTTETIGCIVRGELFPMGLLQPADWDECAEWRARTRAQAMLDLQPSQASMDLAAIKADACAKILTQHFEPRDLISDVQCVYRLAEIALKRGGSWKGNWETFKRELGATSYRDLELAVLKVSGFWTPKKDESENPSPPTTIPI